MANEVTTITQAPVSGNTVKKASTVVSNTAPIVPAQYVGSKTPTPVLQLDKIGQDSHVISVVSNNVNLFNGNIVAVGNLTSDMETFEALPVGADSDLVALIGFDDVCPLEYIPNDERYVEVGKRTRAYILHRGDVITLTNSGIAGGTPVVGDYLAPNGYDLTIGSKPEKGVCFKCVGTQVLAGYPASILMVVAD